MEEWRDSLPEEIIEMMKEIKLNLERKKKMLCVECAKL